MAGYRGVTRSTIISSGGVTVASLKGSSNGRGALRGLDISVEGVPADNNISYVLDRFTANGTATAETNVGYCDVGDAGNNKLTLWKQHSVEPTYASAYLWRGTINQRVTYTVPIEEPFLLSTASGNGVGLFANATASGAVLDITWRWGE